MTSKLAASQSLRLWLSVLSVLGIACLSLGLSVPDGDPEDSASHGDETEWPVTGGAAPGYVPDSACAECHEERFHSFQDSPMSQSFYRMEEGKIPDDLSESSFFHEASGNYYEIVKVGEDFFQRRWRIDADGKRYAEFERRIDWIMGSGTHAQTFLYQTPSGEIFQMPLGWYRGPGFAMSPGYDFKDHQGFQRPITRRCMYCHNAFGETPLGSDQHGEILRHEPETLPSGINCQRCHGPGAAHALLALDLDADDREIRDAIVHPAQIGIERANDVCFQCHLQPSASVNDTVRKLGRGILSFKPGENLRDYNMHFDIFDDASVGERFEINHHAYRLMQSACFVKSEGTMGCITCHSPHNRPEPEERPRYYKRQCLKCHQNDDCTSESRFEERMGVVDDCATCHMPKRRTQDVVLSTATDHLIQRGPAPESYLDPLEEEDGFKTSGARFLFGEDAVDDAEHKLYQALFQVRNGSLGGLSTLSDMVERLEPETAEPYIDLGYGYLKAAELGLAMDSFEEVTERFPERAVGWRNLAEVLHLADRKPEATRAAKRALKLEPDHPDNHFTLARALGGERLKAALASYRSGLALRPNDEHALAEMGKLLLEKGRFAQAAPKLEQAIAAAPREKENYRLLGDARLQMGQFDKALEAWSRGHAIAEYDADFLRKLAFGKLTAADTALRDASAALEYARTAQLVTPRDPDIATEIALALVELGQFEEALVAVKRAEELRADRVVTHALTALACEGLGRSEEAASAAKSAESRGAQRDPEGALRSFVMQRLKGASSGQAR